MNTQEREILIKRIESRSDFMITHDGCWLFFGKYEELSDDQLQHMFLDRDAQCKRLAQNRRGMKPDIMLGWVDYKTCDKDWKELQESEAEFYAQEEAKELAKAIGLSNPAPKSRGKRL